MWMQHSSDTPETRLWRAVAYRAVQDCFNAHFTHMSNAWWWIFKDTEKAFNSFENICTMSDCNAENIKITVAKEFMRKYKNPFTSTGAKAMQMDRNHVRIFRAYKDEIFKYAKGGNC